MNIVFHKNASQGQWYKLSIFEQMGNIGSEVHRTLQWKGRDEKYFQGAMERALELFDMLMADARWRGARLREIAKARELFCSASLGEPQYDVSLEYLDNYFLQFALAARKKA
ncbi:MAG: hypothetical protein HYS60_02080 [Candidatus Wildermuthbacteria bacterium]|nr:hypothetical protein [Candidatus Wildermuthbacteria bacterium]